jgi:hypothetical protein
MEATKREMWLASFTPDGISETPQTSRRVTPILYWHLSHTLRFRICQITDVTKLREVSLFLRIPASAI